MDKLHELPGLPYPARALPPGSFLDLVEVGSRCSTTRVAHPYLGVPTFSRARSRQLTFSQTQSGIRPARDIRLHDKYRPDTNRAGPCHAKSPRDGFVIGVALRLRGPFQPTVQHAHGRPDRRAPSLGDLVETATSAWRPPWVSVLRKSATALG